MVRLPGKRLISSAAAILLCFCMAAVSFAVRTYGDENDTDVERVSATSIEGEEKETEKYEAKAVTAESSVTEEEEPVSMDGEEPVILDEEEPAVSEGKEEQSESEEGSVEENTTEEVPLRGMAAETEEEPFTETGTFGCYTVDRYGSVLNSYYTGDIYYLFLTNTSAPESFELYCTGVKPVEVSAGELNTRTHVISGAFAESGSSVTVTGSNGKQYTVKVMQSSLPSLCITLNGTTLSYINSHDKDVKYDGNSLILTDESGALNLQQNGTVQIKGRGNTNWRLGVKKPYQLKFDKKQTVLGMAKAKKWVLLANGFDDSLIRNTVAFSTASEVDMDYVTEYRHVDLWVDGEYLGTYMIGEKSEINENRLNLTNPTGVLVELDAAFYYQEEYWFKSATYGIPFVVKECVDEDTPGVIEQGMAQFRTKMNAFLAYVENTPPSSITINALKRYIDVDSFVRWYLVNEFAANAESAATSCFFYMDGPDDVIHMGPVWDFDSSMGNRKDLPGTTLMYFKTNSLIFKRLLQSPEYAQYTKDMLVQYDEVFASLPDYVKKDAETVHDSADMNYTRWNVLGETNPKPDLYDYASTYEGAVKRLTDWLVERYGFFTGKSEISAALEGKSVVIRFYDYQRLRSINVATWTSANNQKDLKWTSVSRGSNGWFTVSVPVSSFLSAGKVIIHVYGDGSFQKEAVVTIPEPQVSYSVSENGKMLTITADTIGVFDSVHTAVWSKTGGQDDIVWYTLKGSADGTYTASVNLLNHGESDTYYFHTYGISSGRNVFVNAKTEEVIMDIPKPELVLDKKGDNSTLAITLKNCENKTGIRFAVWGAENGQNDLKWYNGVKQADGSWKANVNLNSHRETGTLYVDCWTAKDYVTGKTCELEFAPDDPGPDELAEPSGRPVLSVTVSEDNKTITCSLTNAPGYTRVRFPSWTTKNGQDDLKWYEAAPDGSGNWTYVIQTASHGGAGEYNVHCYGIQNGVTSIIGGEIVTVNAPAAAEPEVKAEKSGSLVKAEAFNASSYTNVRFAVWTAENGQDDIRWYRGTLSGGIWTYSFNPAAHTPGSSLLIHVYGYLNGKDTFIGAAGLVK